MDDNSDCVPNEDDNSPFNLIYPLSIEFKQWQPQVHLHTLVFGVINPAHFIKSQQTCRENDVFLYKRTLSIPWKYNLYILVNVLEEAYNVNFLTVLLSQAFDVHKSVRLYRKKYRGAYKDNEQSSEHDEASTSVTGKRKRGKLPSSSSCKKKMLSIYPDTSPSQPQPTNNEKMQTAIKLTLALPNVETAATSLYDFSSWFGERFDYERGQPSHDDLSNDLPINQRQSITKEASIQLKRTNNLYVCAFDNREDFQIALTYLTHNCANWTDVYDIPVGLEDDCLRFSLDMFIHNVQLEREIQLRRRRHELISGTGIRSSAFTPLSHLKIEDPSLLFSDDITDNADADLAPEALLEKAFACGLTCQTTTATGNTPSLKKRSMNNEDQTNQKKKIDIFSCFSMANWSLYDGDNRLLTNLDRQTFERLLIKCHPAFFQSLTTPFSKQRFDQLYDTPLLFVPSLVWDIETIASNPCSIPRGVADDEAVVSIALVIERPAVDALRLAMVWVLVPDCLDSEERDNLAKQTLLRVEHEHDLHASPTIFCYTDERAMLYDFCALMIINLPLLYTYMGIDQTYLPAYRDLCTFLIGHNSVGYDYAFILNRCLFFGFEDMAMHLSRKMTGNSDVSREISTLYTFNDAQICIDTMLFLRARMRHLSAFDLRSVLVYYQCEISKLDLDAVQIRHFYHTLYRQGKASTVPIRQGQRAQTCHYAASNANSRQHYFITFLRYNVFDCLSLCHLLAKLSFVPYLTAVMRSFFVPLESAMYRGNSRLLPSILINDCLREKRECLVSTHDNQSIFSVDQCGVPFINEFRQWLEQRSALPASSLAISFEYQPFLDCAAPSIPAHYLHHVYNPYIEFVEYLRTIQWTNRLNDTEDFPVTTTPHNPPSAFHETNSWQLDPDRFHSGADLSLPCDRQLDLLRIGEKNYVGGMNYADPCHIKHPILMDYNSFYPSIIRHYQLDVNNVAIFTVKKLLLAIRPLVLLEEIIQCGVFRLFDYTPLADVEHDVNQHIFSSPHFHALFTPKPYAKREWYEGIEIDSLDLLLASSRSLDRRVLVLMQKIDDSVIARVVTQALHRRNEWKRKKRDHPNDKMIQSRELMDKLLANGTYGYLNYCKSVTFSRPTAAAVTLLCRNTFYRTRFIIESDALMHRLNLAPHLFCAKVIYIDTDGCIVFIEKKMAVSSKHSNPIMPLFNDIPISSQQQGLHLALSCFDSSSHATKDLTKQHIHKDRFVSQVNELLNMQHVKLAAEHYDAVAASVFATKKYALYKVNSLFPPKDSVKKTGFESNAAAPIKLLYDTVLHNISLLNHSYDLVLAERFICKIVRHRAFFHAMFDKLYEWWQAALFAHYQQIKREQDLATGKINDHDMPDPPLHSFKLMDFATKIPLNPKETKGKLAEFIDHVLKEFKYDMGDRVRIFKLAPIDKSDAITLETPNNAYILYDVTATRFELFDIAQENLAHILPDFKYFLGGHGTYLYQCIEGCQTLRERSSSQCEPVEWSNHAAFLAHLSTMQKNGYFCAQSNDVACHLSAAGSVDNDQHTLFLRSFNAIYDLNYATWLWRRILSKRIDRQWHDRVLILWNSHVKTDINKIEQEAASNSAAFQGSLNFGIASKNLPCAPPKLLSAAFFKKWFTAESEVLDKIVVDALFTLSGAVASRQDIAAKRRLLTSGALLYKQR